MDYLNRSIVLATVLAVYFLCPSHQQTAAPNNKCIEDFTNALFGCVKDSGISTGNFLWFTTNGTSAKSEAPANADAFKTQICGVQQAMGACALQKVGAVVNTTSCIGTSASTSQVETITKQLTNLFGTYDVKCMHPCRNTLIPDLQQCYTSNGVDSKLFASNSSSGAAIGTNEGETSKFCGVREKLIACMKEKSDACPEGPRILAVLGLNYTVFSKMTEMLCGNVQSYLSGLSCFAETTNDVQVCQQKQAQSMTQLNVQATQGNWTEDRFFSSYCEIGIEQIGCDITAWSKKNHEACVPQVIALRKKLECEFLPQQCKTNTKLMERSDNVCNPTKLGSSALSSGKGNCQAFLLLIILALSLVISM
ncbi:uncharacterized protein LOC106059554 [Biomphalaria glabrata]|uniref:Uncharacterized protein LOC106059554 n=1 Tax=Biomphalaria glabrata TaxID=6526 RepID=A0A9W2YPW3_BIOGL|nr:uncharacterized protein LOC106059554 [Biomphalaria glabrata]KAI8795917.1 hypothetical protein BgiBS90_003684 [Biomphalaria glabrata]